MKPAKYKSGRVEKQEARDAKLFLIPCILGLVFLTYLPLLAAFALSLFSWRIPGTPSFAGLENYRFLFTEDPFFWTSIRVTLQYGFLSVIGSLVYSMAIALLLNRPMPGRAVFRTVFYLPFIIPAVATFLSWSLILYGSGIVNNIIAMTGGRRIQFLSDERTILPALALIAVWTSGNLILIKMAGLGNVPRTYLEAAEIDGANAWNRFWRITMPCMTPIIFYNMLMSLIGNMQAFVPSIFRGNTGSGGGSIPESYLFMTFTMYRTGFMNGILGRASAISFVFFIMVGIFTVILFATSKYWTFYEGGEPK